MFAKIFTQIFDSSIADDHVARHVFMDLLVLADPTGVVDMTPDAISRRTNVPKEMVAHALQILTNPDTRSRSHLEDGARIVLIDSHRDWGWQIVNYEHYRRLQDEESRRAYFRDKKRESRKKSRVMTESSRATDSNLPENVQTVKDCQTMSTQEEEEGIKTNTPLPPSRGEQVQNPVQKLKTTRELAVIAFSSACTSVYNALMVAAPQSVTSRPGFRDGYEEWKAFRFEDLSLGDFETTDSGGLEIVILAPDARASSDGFKKYEKRWTEALRKSFGVPVQVKIRQEGEDP